MRAAKVAAVTPGFWVIKMLATTLGEVGGNAVTLSLGLGYLLGSVIFGTALLVLLTAQIRATRYRAWLYWSVIVATTLAGTTLADFFDRSLGIGYFGGSVTLLTMVLLTLALWRWTLGSIAVDTVTTPKVEMFYWAAIVFSQTLGTALGDWLADSSGLGYNGSALMIALALVLVLAAHRLTRASPTLLFWIAFVLTRPLGATVANSFDKPVAAGGLDVDDYTMSAALAALTVLGVLLLPQRAARGTEI